MSVKVDDQESSSSSDDKEECEHSAQAEQRQFHLPPVMSVKILKESLEAR